MMNHVHLIVTSNKYSNLGRAIGETHRRYTRMINFREGWKGYLWQGRFASFPMDEDWLLKAAAYKGSMISDNAGSYLSAIQQE